jgi:hypothetical protein
MIKLSKNITILFYMLKIFSNRLENVTKEQDTFKFENVKKNKIELDNFKVEI